MNSHNLMSSHNLDSRTLSVIIAFFVLINIASSGGHPDMWDGAETFLVTESMVLKHSTKIYPDLPSLEKLQFNLQQSVSLNKSWQTGKPFSGNTTIEPFYTARSLLLSAIGVPFYYVANLLKISPLAVVSILVNSLLIGLTSVVIFCLSFEIYGSKRLAFLLGIIFNVCSFIFPYHSTFWPQPLQTLTIIAALFFIYKSLHHSSSFICSYATNAADNRRTGIYYSMLGGLFIGLAIMAHPSSLIVIPGFIGYFLLQIKQQNKEKLVSFLVALIIVVFFIGSINYVRFGSFTEFGYGYYQSLSAHSGWEGVIGLILSPGAGLIFYFPLVILVPLGLKYMYRKDKRLFFLCTYVIVVNWLYSGTLSYAEPLSWTGWIAWGPRYLLPILPFITIAVGALFHDLNRKLGLKISITILCVIGFIVNLFGTLTWVHYGFAYGWASDGLWLNPNSFEIMTWNIHYSPIILNTEALISNYVSNIIPEKFLHTEWQWFVIGLAPCAYDNYIYCKFGIVPILIILSSIAILGMIIVAKIIRRPSALVRYLTVYGPSKNSS